MGAVGRLITGFGRLLLRNRLAIAIASLAWLIYRSGTQPRRISYPCQQAAALNVGAFAAGLIPALWLWRKPACPRAAAARAVVGRQVLGAGLLFVAALLGIEGYQYAQSLVPASLPDVPARSTEPEHTIVGIAQRSPAGTSYTTAEIEAMVRLAIARAGGLTPLMTDRNGDGQISVILKPNLVQGEDPTDGVVTDPRVCAAVVKVAKESGATRVGIAEGTAVGGSMHNRSATWDALNAAGYDGNRDRKFDYDTTVQLHDLNDSGGLHQADPGKVTLVTIPNGVIRTQYYVPNVLLECDVLICVPTFKNHYNGTVTLALKNRIGCAPNDLYHSDGSWGIGFQGKLGLVHYTDQGFACTVEPCPSASNENEIVQRTIVDLNLVRPLDFAVVDGLIGVTTGPNDKSVGGRTGKPNPYMHLIAAGADALAVDAVCSLAMDYDPDYIPHLAWADSRGVLGTKDRSMITLVGDRMWQIRSDDFPSNWGIGATKNTDHAAPALGDISVDEFEPLGPGATVIGTGVSDNVNVVQAAAIGTVLGPNLLANGDFEQAGEGWTTWQAAGGAGPVWNFTSTEPGCYGTQCLKLGGSSVATSFGVWQEVAVEAGKTYRLDAYWRGRKLAAENWFELLLIDGPFSLTQADQPASVKANFMFAYDNTTYGLPGPVGTTFGWLWTHEQYAQPSGQVDWNNRLGRRRATGDVMTVVLKAGSTGGGVEAWFDEVRLNEVQEELALGHTAHPGDPFTLELDTDVLPMGERDVELRVTVYDAALNEASLYRNVLSVSYPVPWVCATPRVFEHTLYVGDPVPADTFEVSNCGQRDEALNYTIDWDKESAGWLDVDPLGGSLTEEPWALWHAIAYDTSELAPGTHAVEVQAAGPDNSVPILVTLHVTTVAPDLDRDGDVDQSDFGWLQACLGVNTQQTQCLSADLTGDSLVSQDDLVVLRRCMAGAGVIPERDCAD